MFYLPEDDKKDRIEDAAMIYWSTTENIYLESLQEKEYLLQSSDNPEILLISKDTQKKMLSDECKIMVNVINDLPEKSFLSSGKVKKTVLFQFVKRKTGWSMTKIEQVRTTLARQLLQMNNEITHMEAMF